MAAGLSADQIDELLHELARRLNARGDTAVIRIVRGAALVARNYAAASSVAAQRH